MKILHDSKIILLCLGDLAVFYLSLFLALLLRYQGEFAWPLWEDHLLPFGLLFVLWFAVFYIAGLYDVRRLRNGLDFFRGYAGSWAVNAGLAIAFFYLIPRFGITPKTNLLLFIAIFGVLAALWRRYFNRLAVNLRPVSRVLFVGTSPAIAELQLFLTQNTQFGYEPVRHQTNSRNELPADKVAWAKLIREERLNLIVLPRHFRRDPQLGKAFFGLLDLGVGIKYLPDFYEFVLRRVPLDEIDEEWFLEHVPHQSSFYHDTKSALEILAALIAQIILLPLEILIALLIALTSRGPVIYRQPRVGRQGKVFTLYKFRSMYHAKELNPDADSSQAVWAGATDKRVTPIGKIIRQTHLDELPQLVNILKGDLAFVGPRPERPAIVEDLQTKVPYYRMRLLLRPGVTGWAQINYPADQTLEDVMRKLEYDIYYLKNRSFVLDIVILVRTLKLFFWSPK